MELRKRRLRLKVTGLPFDDWNFYLVRLLSQIYDLEPSEDPEILLFGRTGVEHLSYECVKIYYTGEKDLPNVNLCDFSFSCANTDTCNFNFPNFVDNPLFQEFREDVSTESVRTLRQHPKTRFCNFVYSNSIPKERIGFCNAMMRRKHVDCPGRVLNNMEPIRLCRSDRMRVTNKRLRWMVAKLHFMKNYKFTVAFENASSVGYTTEKLYHPLLVGSIPVYWGDPRAGEYFNPEAFINAHDFSTREQLVDYVLEVDSNPELYNKYRNAPPILPGSKVAQLSEDRIRERLIDIVEGIDSRGPVSRGLRFKHAKLSQELRLKLKSWLRSDCRKA